MAVLTAHSRKRLKGKTFGLPSQRKYPMPDRSHAANAKARATQQYNKGNLTLEQKGKIDKKANRILGKSTNPQKETDKMKPQTRHDRSDEKRGEMAYGKRMKKDRKDEKRGMAHYFNRQDTEDRRHDKSEGELGHQVARRNKVQDSHEHYKVRRLHNSY